MICNGKHECLKPEEMECCRITELERKLEIAKEVLELIKNHAINGPGFKYIFYDEVTMALAALSETKGEVG